MQQSSPQEATKAPPESEEGLWLFGYGEDHRGTPSAPGRVVTLISHSYWETLGDEVASHLQPSQPPPRVYGAAYHIPPAHIQAVKTYLDIREINGYSIHYTPFIPISTTTTTTTTSNTDTDTQPTIPRCMVYIGLPDNPQFLGRQDPQAVAEVIARSTGPSGKNSEYLFMLAEALEGLAPESGDGHVGDLVGRVRGLMGEGKGVSALGRDKLAGNAVENEVGRVRSGDGGKPDEETEKST